MQNVAYYKSGREVLVESPTSDKDFEKIMIKMEERGITPKAFQNHKKSGEFSKMLLGVIVLTMVVIATIINGLSRPSYEFKSCNHVTVNGWWISDYKFVDFGRLKINSVPTSSVLTTSMFSP